MSILITWNHETKNYKLHERMPVNICQIIGTKLKLLIQEFLRDESASFVAAEITASEALGK